MKEEIITCQIGVTGTRRVQVKLKDGIELVDLYQKQKKGEVPEEEIKENLVQVLRTKGYDA
jgi:hypothetical protein